MVFILGLTAFLIVLAICVAIGAFLIDWFDSVSCHDNSIPFETFKKYYNENSDKWELGSSYVGYKMKESGFRTSTERFCFSLIDCIKYKIWKFNIEIEDAKQYNAYVLSRIEKDYEGEENEVS